MKKNVNIPYFPEIGVISLVPDIWGGPWTVRHQILTRLAKYFNVVWVNPARGWRETWLSGNGGKYFRERDRTINNGLSIYNSSKVLPVIYRPKFIGTFTERQRLRSARSILYNRGCKKIIIYIWRPEYSSSLDLIAHDVSCYHIDDEYTFSEIEKETDAVEYRLISRVDQVIIHSKALLEKKGYLNRNTKYVPNGVDYSAYVAQYDEPNDMKVIPHPRIGYVGVIKKQLDFPLLIDLSERHPSWSFVFVGPYGNLRGCEKYIQGLSGMPNVYFLGNKDIQYLPAYTQHLDICMLCYEINDYTKYIYPLKLHEYLASGRPVLGVPIPSLIEFCNIINLASTTEEWSNALKYLIEKGESSSDDIEIRRNVARDYDWNKLADTVARTLCQHLGGNYFEQIEKEGSFNL